MSRAVNKVTERVNVARKQASERLVGAGMSAINVVVEQRWGKAQATAAALPGATINAQIDAITNQIAREMATLGAAVGGAAAMPIVGTAAEMSAAVGEFALFTTRASDLILTIGALYGHHHAGPDERRSWILAVLVFGDKAAQGYERLVRDAGGEAPGKGRRLRLSVSMVRGINSSMAREMIKRYGARRMMVAAGTALPFGTGALIGGRFNYSGIQTISRQATKFFAKLPYTVTES